jgi:tRNA(fMet)-specific endonuclease VapC
MPRFMLDTNVCSYLVRRLHPEIRQRLEAVTTEEVCISGVVKAELLFGLALSAHRHRDTGAVEDFLESVAVLDFPNAAAAHYADIRADLTKRGLLIGANDLFIAAHARCLGLKLVTNNVREFGRVRKLVIENWTA